MLLSINNFPKFRSYFFYFLKKNIQKGKNLISLSLGQTSSFVCLSVQTHLYILLYDNAVTVISSLFTGDTQGLTFRAISAGSFSSLGRRVQIVRSFSLSTGLSFPKTKTRQRYHSHHQKSKNYKLNMRTRGRK